MIAKMNGQGRVLALFFTRNVSLRDWVERGLFDREKQIYEEYLKNGLFSGVYWLTYGRDDDRLAEELRQQGRLSPAIRVLPVPGVLGGKPGSLFYSLVAPVIYRRQLMESRVFKTNQMDGSWTALIAKKLFKKPLLLRTGFTNSLFLYRQGRSRPIAGFFKLLEKAAYRYCDTATVTSQRDKEYVCSVYGISQSKVTVIPNYIDTSVFFPCSEQRFDDRVVFVGRLNEQKNLFNAIKAVNAAGLSLDIYGDGGQRRSLQQYAHDIGAQVAFKGVIANSKLPEVLNRYRYFLLPSLYEGMPKALLEAMACGCVCIGTDTEGIREVIEDKKDGFLIKGIGAEAIRESLEEALNSEADTVSGNAVRKIREMFSLQVVAEQESKVLERML